MASDSDYAALAYGSDPKGNAHLKPMLDEVIAREQAESQREWRRRTGAAWYVPPTSGDAKRVRAEVLRQGLPLLQDDERWPASPVLFFGSIEGMKVVQRHWGPLHVDWCDWDALKCSTYYAKWGCYLLTQTYGFYPLAEVRRLGVRLWARFGDETGEVFLRPDSNAKVFSGGVVKFGNLEPWLLQAEKSTLQDTTLCVVGHPEAIHAEYRLWLVNGEVVTASRYMLDDRISYAAGCPDGAIRLAEQVAGVWSPHPSFVLDVAEQHPLMPGSPQFFSVLECGSVHTCGLYDCDVGRLVKALSGAAGG